MFSAFLSSLGFILVRKSELLKQEVIAEHGEHVTLPSRYRGLFGGGVVLYISASGPDVVSFMLASEVVCSTIACLRLVIVTILARLILLEYLNMLQIIGIFLCTSGALLCLFFGPRSDQGDFPAISGAKVIPYTVVMLIVMVVAFILSCKGAMVSSSMTRWRYRVWAFMLPTVEASADSLQKLTLSISGRVNVNATQAAIFSIFVVSFALLNFYLNLKGSQSMPVNLFIPLAFALRTIIQFFQSAAILDEFVNVSAIHTWISLFGSMCALVGALCIQPPRVEGDLPCESSLEISASMPLSTDISSRVRMIEGAFTRRNFRAISLFGLVRLHSPCSQPLLERNSDMSMQSFAEETCKGQSADFIQ